MSSIRKHLAIFVASLVLAAGVVPACVAEECCAKTHATNVHREMDCCNESTIGDREAVRVLPATTTVPQAALPVATIEPPISLDVPTTHVIVSFTRSEPDPPLFLLNEQFRI